MLKQTIKRTACASAVSIASFTWAAAHAEPDMESWSKMRGEVINAEELLRADVSNGLNPVGNVTDLVLSPDGRQVQYVLYEVPYPYSLYGAEDGFASYDNIEVEGGVGFDVDVSFEGDASAQAPEELELSLDQAEERLVSRLIGEPMHFSGELAREIEDILIDRDTGAVTHYVIETDEDSIFRAERRTVPADMVMIENGAVVASLQLNELDDMQDYDPALL